MAVADLEGGAEGTRPLKIWSTIFSFFCPFCIRMLKHEVQRARDSIKKQRASRALQRALDFGLSAMCVGGHNVLRPPPPPPPEKILDPPLGWPYTWWCDRGMDIGLRTIRRFHLSCRVEWQLLSGRIAHSDARPEIKCGPDLHFSVKYKQLFQGCSW